MGLIEGTHETHMHHIDRIGSLNDVHIVKKESRLVDKYTYLGPVQWTVSEISKRITMKIPDPGMIEWIQIFAFSEGRSKLNRERTSPRWEL